MSGVWRRVSQSDMPIVSLAEAKRQTNTEDFVDDDILLNALCLAVSHHLDLEGGVTGRAMLTQTWEFTASEPSCIRWPPGPQERRGRHRLGFVLDRTPFQTVTKVETLQSGAYVELPTSDYVVRRLQGEEIMVRMQDGLSWPQTDCDEAAYRITVRLGYGDSPDDVPKNLRHAALMHLAHLYRNRESVSGFGANLSETPLGYNSMIAPYVVPIIA